MRNIDKIKKEIVELRVEKWAYTGAEKIDKFINKSLKDTKKKRKKRQRRCGNCNELFVNCMDTITGKSFICKTKEKKRKK